MGLRFAIADPPYLGRAVRWYGEGGKGHQNGEGQADNHPEAYLWDMPETHQQLVKDLDTNFDGFAIAMSVHSLSTYLEVIQTDSRNGIRVGVWHKPNALPSNSRIGNFWEPVLFKVPQSRRSRENGDQVKDVLTASPLQSGFIGAKPQAWTEWVCAVMGYQQGDEIIDLFNGSGAVAKAIDKIKNERLF